MPKTRKIPMRMCVGCREMKPKREMTRVVKPEGGEAHIDITGKAQGRGAYVCRSEACLKRAIKQKQLERVLEVQLTEEVSRQLQETIAALPPPDGGDQPLG